MGHPDKASKVLLLTFLAAAPGILVLTWMPNGLALVFALAWYYLFPNLQKQEFADWEAGQWQLGASVDPANGWRAVPWGILGFALLFAWLIILFMVLPPRFLPN